MRSVLLLVILLMTTSVSADEPQGSAPLAPPSCAGAGPRQFDFWVGEWEVFGKGGKIVGRSRIESILGGCVIAEHWSSGSGAGHDGKSFNRYNGQTGHWEQFWVDAQGSRLLLSGGLDGKRMVLSGRQADAGASLVRHDRISWTPNADGSVRQLWESSNDEGKTWTTAFDGTYRRPARK